MLPLDAYRYTALLLASIDLLLWIAWAIRYRQYRGYAWAPLAFLAASAGFWAWLIFIRPAGEQLVLTNWLSATLQIFGLILLGGAALVLRDRK